MFHEGSFREFENEHSGCSHPKLAGLGGPVKLVPPIGQTGQVKLLKQ
jgi:hypothetical protein